MSMQREYTQAFIELITSGISVDEALKGLKTVLKQKHHEKLLPVILNESLRTLSANVTMNSIHVSAANAVVLETAAGDIKKAAETLGAATDTALVSEIDETLIGGFVVTFNHQEYDRSYKRVLRSLYESITV